MITLSILVLACYVGAERSHVPPRIDVGQSVVVWQGISQGYFDLRCEGSETPFWHPPNSSKQIFIKTAQQENSKYPFITMLTIPEPEASDSGVYICAYENASNFETDTDNVAKTYMTVKAPLPVMDLNLEENRLSSNLLPKRRPLYSDREDLLHHRYNLAASIIEISGVPDYVKVEGRGSLRQQVHCKIQGYPIPSVEWKFKSCPDGLISCLSQEDMTNIKTDHLGNNVIVKTVIVELRASGIVQCTARNLAGSDTKSKTVVLSDWDGLYGFQYSERHSNTTVEITGSISIRVFMDDEFTLTCFANKFYTKSLTLNTPHSSRYHVNDHSTDLTFVNVLKIQVERDMGRKFSCITERYDGSKLVNNVTFIVREKKPPIFLKDSNMNMNESFSVKENGEFTIKCHVTGSPAPTISWFKDGIPLHRNADFFIHTAASMSNDRQELRMLVFEKKHRGQYMCMAENEVSSLTGMAYVEMVGISDFQTTTTVVIIIFCILGVASFICMAFIIRYLWDGKRIRRPLSAKELHNQVFKKVPSYNLDCAGISEEELFPCGEDWEVPREQIVAGKHLYSGYFGWVVKGKMKTHKDTEIVVKMYKRQETHYHIHALAFELRQIVHVGAHRNIVRLMGLNSKNIIRGEVWVLMEFCLYRDLVTFLHNYCENFVDQINHDTGHIDTTNLTQGSEKRKSLCTTFNTLTARLPDITKPITTSTLLSWALQIAHGMHYIISRKVLHCNLMASNVLLANNNVVKITGFSQSRMMNSKDNSYNYILRSSNFPSQWMPPETLREKTYDQWTDLWSYGVTLWEIFTLGNLPYPATRLQDILQQIDHGNRLPCPQYANQEIYQLMLDCWAIHRKERPPFKKIIECVNTIMKPSIAAVTPVNESNGATSQDATDQVNIHSPVAVSYNNTAISTASASQSTSKISSSTCP